MRVVNRKARKGGIARKKFQGEIIMQEKDFIAYEYTSKTVKAEEQARIADLYEAFGWEIVSVSPTALNGVTLSLRRDRKLKHRQELLRLERQAENTLKTIEGLNRSKTLASGIFAYVFGIIAALVLGGGMCLVMLHQGQIAAMAGGIVLGLAGIVLCAVNYPIYKKLTEKRSARVLPAVDENEEKLAGLLEQGNDLLHAEII